MQPNANIATRRWNYPYPVMERAEGIYLYDIEGKRYIDGSGGSSAVTSIGHGVREVLEAMSTQAQAFCYNPSHASINRPALDLADMLAELAPGELRHNCRTWLTVSGTDATDDAVRLARQHWVEKGLGAKFVTIARWQAYHGINLGSAGYSGNTMRRSMFLPMLVDSPHIPPAYCYRCQLEKTYPECNLLCARALETTIRQIGPENVSAFIAEPVVGASLGAVPAPPGYFQLIREICDRYDVLLIADEVMTGCGRTGRMWGLEHWDVTPDIIAAAKGLSGGYAPVAAVIARNKVWQPLIDNRSSFRSGHTMNAHPVTCAAAVATLHYLLDHDLVANAREMGAHFLRRLRELLDHPLVGDVHGMGLMVGFELVQDREARRPFPLTSWVSQRFAAAAQERGLIVYPLFGSVDGVAGDMVKMAPPLTINRDQVDDMVAIVKDSLDALLVQLQSAGLISGTGEA